MHWGRGDRNLWCDKELILDSMLSKYRSWPRDASSKTCVFSFKRLVNLPVFRTQFQIWFELTFQCSIWWAPDLLRIKMTAISGTTTHTCHPNLPVIPIGIRTGVTKHHPVPPLGTMTNHRHLWLAVEDPKQALVETCEKRNQYIGNSFIMAQARITTFTVSYADHKKLGSGNSFSNANGRAELIAQIS